MPEPQATVTAGATIVAWEWPALPTLFDNSPATLSVISAAARRTYTVKLAPEAVETSDGRIFQPGALRWRDSVPLTWSPDEGGHDSATLVGNVVNLRFEVMDDATWAVGDIDWDDSEQAVEAKRLVDEGRQTGVSVHLGAMTADWVCRDAYAAFAEDGVTDQDCDFEDALLVVSDAEIAAATLVLIPAFADAGVVAAVGSVKDWPVAGRNVAWDQAAADARWREYTESGDAPSDAYRDAFLWWGADTENFGAYKLQVADVVDGQPAYVPRAIFAAAGGRGVNRADIPEADKDRVRAVICGLYGRINDAKAEDDAEVTCPFSAITAAVDLAVPDAALFAGNLDGPTPLTVDDDGAVFGHLALWDTCHRGFTDRCVTPPRGGDYGEFHRNARVRLADGELLPVGCLTMDLQHAHLGLGADRAAAHYDHSGTVAAYVRAGEDEWGVWVAGVVAPDLTTDRRVALGRLSLSGDWRQMGGSLRLIAAQAVPVPGFAIAAGADLTTVGLDRVDLLAAQVAALAAAVGLMGDRLAPVIDAEIAAVADRLLASLDA
jgi:hypothetical protein